MNCIESIPICQEINNLCSTNSEYRWDMIYKSMKVFRLKDFHSFQRSFTFHPSCYHSTRKIIAKRKINSESAMMLSPTNSMMMIPGKKMRALKIIVTRVKPDYILCWKYLKTDHPSIFCRRNKVKDNLFIYLFICLIYSFISFINLFIYSFIYLFDDLANK